MSFTTRPMRENEINGREYIFVTDEEFDKYKKEHKILESREYKVASGDIWKYFEVDDINYKDKFNYIGIGTIESYNKIKDIYGPDMIRPIYIDADDDIRRERLTENRSYSKAEINRRIEQDNIDFSKEKLSEIYNLYRFKNNTDIDSVYRDIEFFIYEDSKFIYIPPYKTNIPQRIIDIESKEIKPKNNNEEIEL
jgi:guanylate kinase